jgi:hypothetical protein
MILRSYSLHNVVVPKDYVFRPGNNVDSFFRASEAYALLDNLDIPWELYSRHDDATHHEVIFAILNEQQYTLWKIAGGEHYSEDNELMGMTPKRLTFSGSLENIVYETVKPLGFSISFEDGSVNFTKDDMLISVYNDGGIRGIGWPDRYHFAVPNSETFLQSTTQMIVSKILPHDQVTG